jgi:PadR family transcriptional regulator PadR
MSEPLPITSQMKKGTLEFLTLAIISKGESYTNDIIKSLKKANLIVVEGTMYPLLSRLKSEKLLEYLRVESQQGPPRKYYKLTTKGKETLKSLHKERDQLMKSVTTIIQL